LPAFLIAGLVLYYPCFAGPFLSDDVFAVLNPYASPLSVAKIFDLFSPYGAATTMHSEYRPIWFLLHGLERHAFGDSVVGYHVTNVVLHTLASALVVLLFGRSGLPAPWPLLGGTLFLVHPANVEAVAWISQLTSDAALALALVALLLAPRHAPAALLCFVLALLTKPLAAFALPIAALFAWVEDDDVVGRRTRRAWLGAWLLAFAVFVAIESVAARGGHYGVEPMHADPVVVARTIVANFLRYVVMAMTGHGLAAFHQAQPALSWLDPWWLGGATALVLLGGRATHMLVRRRPEGVYWAWALLAFAPVSQVVPFTHPLADRYLYFILPGLLGGALLAVHTAILRQSRESRRAALQFATALTLILSQRLRCRRTGGRRFGSRSRTWRRTRCVATPTDCGHTCFARGSRHRKATASGRRRSYVRHSSGDTGSSVSSSATPSGGASSSIPVFCDC
jgi:hypothetical protein